MRLIEIAEHIFEVDAEDRKRPPSTKGRDLISSAQAAQILGVTVSRVRQMHLDGELHAVIHPQKGDRDLEFSKKDVMAKKSQMHKMRDNAKINKKKRKGED